MGDLLVLVMVRVRLTPVVEASVPACLPTGPMVSVRSASVITCFRGFPCGVPLAVTVTTAITVGPAPGVFAATVPDWMVGVTALVLLLSPQAASRADIARAPHSCKISMVLFRDSRCITLTHFSSQSSRFKNLGDY